MSSSHSRSSSSFSEEAAGGSAEKTPDKGGLRTSPRGTPSEVAPSPIHDAPCVAVSVFVRPFLPTEPRSLAVRAHERVVVVKVPDRAPQAAAVDAVFWGCDVEDPETPNASAEDIYAAIGRPLVRQAVEGKCGCLLVYGALGSGRTHAILGADAAAATAAAAAPAADGDGGEAGEGLLQRIVKELVTPTQETYIAFVRVSGDRAFDLLSGSAEVQVRLARGTEGYALRGLVPRKLQSGDTEELLPLVREALVGLDAPIPPHLPKDMSRVSILRDFSPQPPGASHLLAVIYTRHTDAQDSPFARIIIGDIAQAADHDTRRATPAQQSCVRRSLLSLRVCLEHCAAHARAGRDAPLLEASDAAGVAFRDCTLTKLLIPCMVGRGALVQVLCTVAPSSAAADRSAATVRFAGLVKRYPVHGNSLLAHLAPIPEAADVDAAAASFLREQKNRLAKGRNVAGQRARRKALFDQRVLAKAEAKERQGVAKQWRRGLVHLQRLEFAASFEAALAARDAERCERRAAHVAPDNFESLLLATAAPSPPAAPLRAPRNARTGIGIGIGIGAAPTQHRKKAMPVTLPPITASPPQRGPRPPPRTTSGTSPALSSAARDAAGTRRPERLPAISPRSGRLAGAQVAPPMKVKKEENEAGPPEDRERSSDLAPSDATAASVPQAETCEESESLPLVATPPTQRKGQRKGAVASPGKQSGNSASSVRSVETAGAEPCDTGDGIAVAATPVRINWDTSAGELPTGMTPSDAERRAKLFARLIRSGCDQLSLADLEQHSSSMLGAPTGFSFKSTLLRRALEASKQRVREEDVEEATRQDLMIRWAEFRLFLVYLRDYWQLCELFASPIDPSAAQHMDVNELERAVPLLRHWRVTNDDSNDAPAQALADLGSSTLHLDDFADWAIRRALSREAVGDFDFSTALASGDLDQLL